MLSRHWDIPKFTYRQRDWYNVVKYAYRYDFDKEEYIYSGKTTLFSTRSKYDAHKYIEHLEQCAKERIGKFNERNGEYAFMSSTDDLHVAIYGYKYHFTIIY